MFLKLVFLGHTLVILLQDLLLPLFLLGRDHIELTVLLPFFLFSPSLFSFHLVGLLLELFHFLFIKLKFFHSILILFNLALILSFFCI